MNRFALFAMPVLALVLAGCSSTGTSQVAQAPVVTAPVVAQPLVPSSAQTVQQARLTTNISSGFVDPAALAVMTAKDSNEANSAQFYAARVLRASGPATRARPVRLLSVPMCASIISTAATSPTRSRSMARIM